MNIPKKNRRSELSNWSNIIPEVLQLIVNLLDSQDRIALRMVCKSWRNVALNHSLPLSSDPIRLMIPRQLGHTTNMDFGFFSILHRKFNGFQPVKMFRKWRCCGHTDGWFAMVSDDDFDIVLLDIIHNSSISLPRTFPSIRKFADGLLASVTKIVMSSSPIDDDCLVMVMSASNSVAVCRPRGDWWVLLKTQNEAYEDLRIFKGRLYALHFDGKLTVYSLGSFPRILRDVVLEPGEHLPQQRDYATQTRYLVESLGELLLATNHYTVNFRGFKQGQEFKVYELDDKGWVPLTSLADQALFISQVNSESISVADNNESPYLKQNHIYFASKHINELVGHLMGVFSMKDQSIAGIPVHTKTCLDCEPIWIKSFLI